MRFCICCCSALLLAASTVALAQEPNAPPPSNPFGGGDGGQPPAPQAVDPFGGGAPANQPAAPGAIGAPAAEATGGELGGDADKEKKWLDDMVEKKVLIKTQLKGKIASMWIGAPFLDLAESDQQMVIRLAYKALIGKENFKIPPAMTIYASDGQRQGPRLGLYKVTAKGEDLKLSLPNPQQLQQPEFIPQQPTTPPDPDDF
jgi:hypothetical protein